MKSISIVHHSDHLKFFEPMFPMLTWIKEGEKCMINELIKADEIPNELIIKKIRAYADVAELYKKVLKEGIVKIEPELAEATIKDFLKRKVDEI